MEAARKERAIRCSNCLFIQSASCSSMAVSNAVRCCAQNKSATIKNDMACSPKVVGMGLLGHCGRFSTEFQSMVRRDFRRIPCLFGPELIVLLHAQRILRVYGWYFYPISEFVRPEEFRFILAKPLSCSFATACNAWRSAHAQHDVATAAQIATVA